jgi:hypothetical protein
MLTGTVDLVKIGGKALCPIGPDGALRRYSISYART